MSTMGSPCAFTTFAASHRRFAIGVAIFYPRDWWSLLINFIVSSTLHANVATDCCNPSKPMLFTLLSFNYNFSCHSASVRHSLVFSDPNSSLSIYDLSVIPATDACLLIYDTTYESGGEQSDIASTIGCEIL